MLFLQSQDTVQPQFLLAPLDKKTVGVVEKRDHDQSQQAKSNRDQYHGIHPSGQCVHNVILQNKVKHKVSKHGKDTHPDIGEIDGSVLTDIRPGHPGQKQCMVFHCGSFPMR